MSSSRSQAQDPVPPLTPASRTRSRRLAQESPKAPPAIPVVPDSPAQSSRLTRSHDQLGPRDSPAREQERCNGVNIREETLSGSKSRRVTSPQRQSRLIVSIPLSDPLKRGRDQDDQENAEAGQKHKRLLDGSKSSLKKQEASIIEASQPLMESMESSNIQQSSKDGVSTRSSSRNRPQRHHVDIQERHHSQRVHEPDPQVLEKENGQGEMEIEHPVHPDPPQDITADEAGDVDPADRDRSEPPSQDDGDEEPFENVPEYIKREMQEFEQGFNGLEGKFKLLDKIGEGTFSSVYKAVDLEHDEYSNSHWDYGMDEQPLPDSRVDKEPAEEKKSGAETGKVVAIKRIYVTSSPKRIENEIRILHELSGHKNVVPLVTAFRYRDQVIVVLPYFEHKDFRSYYRTLPMDDIRCYLRALLKALAHVHSHKIIHRDVKPSNFLYDLEKRTGVLVDFGLAHKQKEPSAATIATTSKSTASAPKATNTSRSAPTTTTGTEAVASSSNVPTAPLLEQQGMKPPQSQSNKENIEPAPPKNRVESAPTISLNQPNSHPERLTVLRDEGQTSSSQSTRIRTVFVPPATSAQALQAMPVASTPNLANHVRPNPATATSLTLPSVPAIPQTSITATNREPGFLKKDNRPSLRVNRAGTRGFRAPEILFRHVRQTVALDIWSVGVILISILSGRFPFFNSADDAEAILEVGVLFGNREMQNVAAKFNRSFETNVPSIKELPISLLRIIRLLYPKRFGPPDGYVSKLHPPKPRPQGRPERQPSASSSRPPQQPSASAQGTAAAVSNPGGSDRASLKTSQQPLRQQKPKQPIDRGPTLPVKEAEPAESEQQVPLRQVLESLPVHNDTSEQTPLKAEKTKDATGLECTLPKIDRTKDVTGSEQTLLKTKDITNAEETPLKTNKTKDTTVNERRDVKAAQKPTKVLKRIVGWDNQEELELAVDLLERLLALDPKGRITAEEALGHPFLAKTKNP